MNKIKVFTIFPLLIFAAVGIGFFLGNNSVGKPKVSKENEASSDKVSSIINFIEKNYVDTVDVLKLTDRTIHDILQNLDPHSSYIPAKRLDQVNEGMRGNFGGIGIRFLIHDDTLVATHIIEGSPSEQAGLLPGESYAPLFH